MRLRHALLWLVCLNLAVFVYTAWLRSPWFGRISEGDDNGTAAAVKFARNWYAEGAWALRFAMLENPASIEFDSLKSRDPYVSYPPGAVLPIYALGWLTGEPNVALAMGYNLANHLLVALGLGIAVLLLLWPGKATAGWPVTALASISSLIALLMPGPLYWHQQYWFADSGAILPFALVIALEAWRDRRSRRSGWVDWGIRGVLFWMFLTDWLSVFVAAVLFAKRAVRRQLGGPRDIALFWAPAAAAATLYLVQLAALGVSLEHLFDKFQQRSWLPPSSFERRSWLDLWLVHVPHAFGRAGLALLLMSLAACAVAVMRSRGGREGELGRLASFAGLALFPPLLQTLVFASHSAIHDFAALKFVVPLALVPFALVPGAAFPRIEGRERPLAFAALIGLAAAWIGAEHMRAPHLFVRPGPGKDIESLGNAVRLQSAFEDVLFSPDLEIPSFPSWILCYSMKRVYRVSSASDLRRDLPPGARIVLVLIDSKEEEWSELLGDGATPFETRAARRSIHGEQTQLLRFYAVRR